MIRIHLATILLLSLLGCDQLQQLSPSPSEVYFKVFGGPFEQQASDILQTEEGDLLLLGSTTSYTQGEEWDIFLVRTDRNGNEIWNKHYDFSERNDVGRSMIKAHDEGYMICGTSTDEEGNELARLIKVDGNGNELWPNALSWIGRGEDVVKTSDGGYLFIGTTSEIDPLKADGFSPLVQDSTDILAVKVDGGGNEVWRKVYGYKGVDKGVAVEALGGGRYALLGTTDFPQNGRIDRDFVVILINEDGNPFHTQTFGGPDREIAQDLVIDRDDNIVILGISNEGLQLQKVSNTLQTDWLALHNGIQAGAIKSLSSGAYMLVGSVRAGNQGDKDILLIQTDENGNTIWEQTYGSSEDDFGAEVIPLDGGGYALLGTIGFGANTMIGLIKTNQTGRLLPQ